MSRDCRPKLCSGSLRHAITIERRGLQSAAPGSAVARYDYEPVITTRAALKTKSGVSQFNKVEINGQSVSHVFSIRYTAIDFDVRDRVKDARGELYAILAVNNVDHRDEVIEIYSADLGQADREVVQ